MYLNLDFNKIFKMNKIKFFIILAILSVSTICNAQNSDVLKIYRLTPETMHSHRNQELDTSVLYGKITKQMVECIELRRFFSAGTERFEINIRLKKHYWCYFQSISEKFIGSPMGIFFNGELISVSNIINPISRGGFSVRLYPQNKAELIYSNFGGTSELSPLPDYYFADFYPDARLLYEQGAPVDSIVWLYANAILSTPDSNRISRRNRMKEDIIAWFFNDSGRVHLIGEESGRYLELNDFTLQFVITDTVYFPNGEYRVFEDDSIIPYYTISLMKAFTANPTLPDTEIKIMAIEYLIEYLFNEKNHTEYRWLMHSFEEITQNPFFYSLQDRENIRRLVELYFQ